jgi:uncharacterized protein (TIGR00730 family)
MKTLGLAVIALASPLPGGAGPSSRAGHVRWKAGEPPVEMTTYYLVMLVKGPKWTPEQSPPSSSFRKTTSHTFGSWPVRQDGPGRPLTDGGTIRGLCVFKAASLEEARAFEDDDPAVKAGRWPSRRTPGWCRKASCLSRLERVCVYCASSTEAHPEHYEATRTLGRLLAEAGITIVYGGGSVGSMGALADAALAAGGRLVGILPKFMNDLEWGHKSLTELRLVDDMHHRKRMMIEESDAIVALPGGSGTFEELLEAITWKRLGLVVSPIVIVNVRGFYDPLRALLGPRDHGALHGRAPSADVDVRRFSGRRPRRHPGRARMVGRGARVRPARSRPSRLTWGGPSSTFRARAVTRPSLSVDTLGQGG